MESRKQTLTFYHEALSPILFKSDLWELESKFWKGRRKPKGATDLFEVHRLRVFGQGCPQDCDDKLEELIKR